LAPRIALIHATPVAIEPAVVSPTHVAAGALSALQAGDGATHDALIAKTAGGIGPVDAVLLEQFSMAQAERAVAAVTRARILTSPASAVQRLRRQLNGRSA
jgi:hypothetical protein